MEVFAALGIQIPTLEATSVGPQCKEHSASM